MAVEATDVVRALRGGPATIAALAARLPGADAEQLRWALDDAIERGWATSTATADCGPDGVCGSAPPTILSATDAGRAELE